MTSFFLFPFLVLQNTHGQIRNVVETVKKLSNIHTYININLVSVFQNKNQQKIPKVLPKFSKRKFTVYEFEPVVA